MSKEEKRKRKHSHHSRHASSDDSDQSESTDCSTDSNFTDSDSSVEIKPKKRRSSSDGRKERKKEKRDSKKSKKKHKEVKKKRKSKKPKIVEISEDDYYLKSAEFRTWLSKERDTFFSELTSEESRSLFRKFVTKWNKGLLDKVYYKGIQSSAVPHDTQSKYEWKFASGLDSKEMKSMRDSVSSWSAKGSESIAGPSQPTRDVIGPSRGPVVGPIRGPSTEDSPYDRQLMREEKHSKVKKDRRDFRKQRELVLDELLPKATGKEAKFEKKRVRAEARREKEYSPEPMNPYQTGPSDSIQARIRSIQVKREKKASSAAQKISDYRAKEKSRMDAILEMARANKKEGALW